MTEQLKAAARQKLRKILQHHGLTVHGDGVVEGDIWALFDELAADVVLTEREGWRWVPVEPTAKMAVALYEAMRHLCNPKQAAEAWADVLAAAPQPASEPQPVYQTCNCRWDGETQVAQCELHAAHVEAIHEWAERAKSAEAKLKEPQPAPVGVDASDAPSLMDSARRAIEAWDCTVLERGRDGMLQERMECLRWFVRAEGGEA